MQQKISQKVIFSLLVRGVIINRAYLYARDLTELLGRHNIHNNLIPFFVGFALLYLKEKGTGKIAVNINLQQEFDELAIKFNLLNPFKKKINIPTDVLILIFSQITDIYNYGGEILTVFLMQLNQYSKTNKNQVFTPPHIADFICQAKRA